MGRLCCGTPWLHSRIPLIGVAMRLRLAAALASLLLLAGCSMPNWHDLFEFSDDREVVAAPRPVASAAPAPAGAQGAPDPFCVSVAQQDAQRGQFDDATQQRMIQRGYQQCVALFRGP